MEHDPEDAMRTGFESLSVEDFDKELALVEGLCSDPAVRPIVDVVRECRRRLHEALLPGWMCSACKAFNGDVKEKLSACRCCGLARQT
jgi:hypothetical protein